MSQHDHKPRIEDLFLTRRELLCRCGTGLGAFGLAGLLSAEGALGAPAAASNPFTSALAPKASHFPAKAKHVIHLFMNGGPSQIDTFDPKPELARWEGKRLPVLDQNTNKLLGRPRPLGSRSTPRTD